MSVTLDRSRPFTQVYGIAAHAFEQGGVKFDHAGNALDGEPEASAPVKAKPVKPPVKAEPDQVDAQLNG